MPIDLSSARVGPDNTARVISVEVAEDVTHGQPLRLEGWTAYVADYNSRGNVDARLIALADGSGPPAGDEGEGGAVIPAIMLERGAQLQTPTNIPLAEYCVLDGAIGTGEEIPIGKWVHDIGFALGDDKFYSGMVTADRPFLKS